MFRGTEVFFPQQRRPYSIGPTAGGSGKLVLDGDGCIRMKPLPRDPGMVPIWPAEFDLDAGHGEIRILDGKGRIVAKVGEEVAMAGGDIGNSLKDIDGVDERTKRELLRRGCRRDYWLVTGDVHMPQRK